MLLLGVIARGGSRVCARICSMMDLDEFVLCFDDVSQVKDEPDGFAQF